MFHSGATESCATPSGKIGSNWSGISLEIVLKPQAKCHQVENWSASGGQRSKCEVNATSLNKFLFLATTSKTRFHTELETQFLGVHLRTVAMVEIFRVSWLNVCETSIHIWSAVGDHKLYGFADIELIIINASLCTFYRFSCVQYAATCWFELTERYKTNLISCRPRDLG